MKINLLLYIYFIVITQSQSMVMRVTIYHDEAKIIVQEIHEWFENRKDKMYKRIRNYLGDKRFVELYHPGRLLLKKYFVIF